MLASGDLGRYWSRGDDDGEDAGGKGARMIPAMFKETSTRMGEEYGQFEFL